MERRQQSSHVPQSHTVRILFLVSMLWLISLIWLLMHCQLEVAGVTMAPLDSPHLEVSEQLGRDELWLGAGRLLHRLSESVSAQRVRVYVYVCRLIKTVSARHSLTSHALRLLDAFSHFVCLILYYQHLPLYYFSFFHPRTLMHVLSAHIIHHCYTWEV